MDSINTGEPHIKRMHEQNNWLSIMVGVINLLLNPGAIGFILKEPFII